MKSVSAAFLVVLTVLFSVQSFADPVISRTYQNYIDQEWQSPFTDRDKALTELREEVGPGLTKALDLHVQREKKLMEFRAELEEKAAGIGLDPKNIAESVFARLRLIVENPQSPELNAFIVPAAELAESFFTMLDSQIQDSMDLTLAISFHGLRLWIAENLNELSPKEVKEFKTLYDQLQKSLKKYIENKDQYGQNKDTLRVSPYKRYFNTLAAFAKEKAETASGEGKQNAGFFEWIKKTCTRAQKIAGLAPYGLDVVKKVLFPQNLDGVARPLGRSIHRAIRAMHPDIEIRVTGEENLPVPKLNSNRIYIFAASHKDGLGDQLGLSELMRTDLVIFGAPNNFIKAPGLIKNLIIRKLDENTGFVVVGKGSSERPIEKAVRLAVETGARSFLIFPEGRLPEGIGGSMGIRDGFNAPDGLIAQLEAAGFEVYIVPVSMRNNARLFSGKALSELSSDQPGLYNSGLDVRVAPQIDPKLRKALDQIAGPRALSFILRFGLLEDMITDENLLWGQLRADRLVPQLARHIGPPASDCAALLLGK